ncbi:unnamed protein product [Allacma fusca]|uniref:Glutamate decarboxylase n=1 Tax=Allacma fusca TaxID=39272 RepID=A0A8J2LQS6_9HEXA|nr:unnamed protein product [Allacma fusca]
MNRAFSHFLRGIKFRASGFTFPVQNFGTNGKTPIIPGTWTGLRIPPVRQFTKTSLVLNKVDRGKNVDIGKRLYQDLLPWDNDGNKATQEFLQRVFLILMDFINQTNDRNSKVVDFHQPDDLLKLINLNLPNDPKTLDQVLNDFSASLNYVVKAGHPNYYTELACGLDTIAMAGEWLIATSNCNMFTYEVSPVFIIMEDIVLRKMREIIGYPDGNGDSIFAPDTLLANLYAVLAARFTKFPASKAQGVRKTGTQLCMFTSEHSQTTLKSCAMITGLGTNNCIMVPTDDRGKMIPSELEKLIRNSQVKGMDPFFVNCTAGTTMYGAFDPINEIADVCERYNLWLHVNASWGGATLLSKKYRHPRMTGIERAHSITWSPHYMMATTRQCSTIHFRMPDLLNRCNSLSAQYLFQRDKFYDIQYDTGDKVIQCGRHNDVFKLWLQWRAKGTSGLGKHVDHQMEMNQYLLERMRSMPEKFHLVVPYPEYVNACFWYVPKRLQSMRHGKERETLLGEVSSVIKRRMMNKGSLMLNCARKGNNAYFFEAVISNPGVEKADLDFLIEELDRLGKDL